MRLHFTAGKFEIETYTEGYPNWMRITHDGKEIAHGIHHSELRDLAYVISRMLTAGRANMPDRYKHEYD